jgi:hypothetical protein
MATEDESGKHLKDRKDDSYSRQCNGHFLILPAGPNKWSRRFQTGPVPHLSMPAGVDALHDEIIVEARDGIEDQVRAIVKESMEEAFEKAIPKVPFVTENRVAEAWGG